MNRIELALGPVFFNWPPGHLVDFYARIADEAPVDRVYVGEVVCGKRQPFSDPVWPRVIARLERAGKTVVVSTLALPATRRERSALADLADLGRQIEINDMSALAARSGRPFTAGPFLNIYNETALAALGARGAETWCPPVELPLSSITAVARACPGVDVELFAFGRLPLAVSGRCYHARAHGLNKDSCGFVCETDPDGMAVSTLDGQAFLAVNGIQTLSHAVQTVLMTTDSLAAAGIRRLRLSPHSVDMVRVAHIYRDVLDSEITVVSAESRIGSLGLPGTVCNAYLAGEPGWRMIAL